MNADEDKCGGALDVAWAKTEKHRCCDIWGVSVSVCAAPPGDDGKAGPAMMEATRVPVIVTVALIPQAASGDM
jgi:hypothetical protein